jgi:hypothetical protein
MRLRGSAVFVIALSVGALTGCPVDERPLKGLKLVFIGAGGAGDDGAAGEGEAGGGLAGAGDGMAGSNTSHEGGTGNSGGARAGAGGIAGSSGSTPQGGSPSAGSAGSAGTAIAGMAGAASCPDLDDNQVLDCEETIVGNASFDTDTAGWLNENDTELAWEHDDAMGQDDSGSLALESSTELDQDGSKLVGVRQCFPVFGGGIYRFGAQTFVPAEAGTTHAGFQLIVYDSAQCAGTVVGIANSNTVKGAEWTPLMLPYEMPLAGRSCAFRLISVKPFRQPPATVYFDNILVRTD